MDYKTFENPPPILQRLKLKGYKVFDGEDHDLNLIGVRSPNRIAGEFDDPAKALHPKLGAASTLTSCEQNGLVGVFKDLMEPHAGFLLDMGNSFAHLQGQS